MTVHIVADASHMLGFLRMSDENARAFLTDLRNRRSIVATGDEDGTVQIEYEITEAGPVLSVRKLGQHRWVIGRFDLKTTADDLLADLGV